MRRTVCGAALAMSESDYRRRARQQRLATVTRPLPSRSSEAGSGTTPLSSTTGM